MDAIEPGHIAVIFVSRRTGADAEGYAEAAAAMDEAVRAAPGYLGHDSVGSDDGGITISYWRDMESVAAWREEITHAATRERGRAHWYDWYRLVVATVDRTREWTQDKG